MDHPTVSPICEEIFKRIDDNYGRVEKKIDQLIERGEQIDCKYDEHIKSSEVYRNMVERHDEILKDIVNLKRWWLTAAFAIIGALVSIAVQWGNLQGRVASMEKSIGNAYASEESHAQGKV